MQVGPAATCCCKRLIKAFSQSWRKVCVPEAASAGCLFRYDPVVGHVGLVLAHDPLQGRAVDDKRTGAAVPSPLGFEDVAEGQP